MEMYQPHKYEIEAFDWAVKTGRYDLVNAVRAMQDCFDETRAEAGRYIDELASARLSKVSKFLRDAYIKCNGEWANAYRRAGF